MKLSLCAVLLIGAAALMIFAALGYTLVLVPDLHGDLVEIGVRPTVLGGTVLYLYFSAAAMFGFALMVSAAAIQAIRARQPVRVPLAIIAVIYMAFGIIAFSRSRNPHHLGLLAIGVLLAAALAMSRSKSALT